MPYSSYAIHPLERLLLLILDPLINFFCVYLPLVGLLLPFFFMEWMPANTFMHCSIFLFFATYFNKDIAAGKSLGKRLLGYVVVNVSDGLPARRPTCFLRNLTFPFYAVELIYGLFSTNKKIMDHFTDTKVIKTFKDANPFSSFFHDLRKIPYNNETREVFGLTVLLFLLIFFLN